MTSSDTVEEPRELDEFEQQILREFKKRQLIKRVGLGVGAVFAIAFWYLLQPVRGGLEFGVCKTYLEQYVRYPRTLRLSQYDKFGRSFRIYYTYRDSFGMEHSEMIECISTHDPAMGLVMQQIKIDRKAIDPKKLELFNRSIPSILSTDLDLAIPRLRNDQDLSKLKID